MFNLKRMFGRSGNSKLNKKEELVDAAQSKAPVVRGDNPIRSVGDDTLGRAQSSRSFARQLLEIDASEGAVVGVLGPWGSGKTSFFNLARPELEAVGVYILEFNPWMFSGAQQLVESFFIEISAQLKIRPDLSALAGSLEDYGEAFSDMGWLPLAGPWIERSRAAMKILGKVLQHRKEGVGKRREKIESALRQLKTPILVFLDDIDRLSSSEIRDIFKLVRLTASFPNLVYVMAFDRNRVEQALGEEGVPGRSYLEKILQVAIDLPPVPSQVLTQQVAGSIQGALQGIENCGPFDEKRWPDIFVEIIRPLVQNMRDVRRYSAAVRGTVTALEGQVALVDVLGLEAIRIFMPDTFAKFHSSVDDLTTTSGAPYGAYREQPELKARVNHLVTSDAARAHVLRNLIHRLFPAAERHIGGSQYSEASKTHWLRNRRVAHDDIFGFYLERVAGEGLRAFANAEQAWNRFTNRMELDRYLRSLDKEELEDVVLSLGAYEDKFKPEHVVPGIIVLLNLLPDIPKRDTGMLELDIDQTVAILIFRLLKSLKEPALVEAALHQILPELTSLTSKIQLIDIVGQREGIGQKLVSETVAADVEKAWRNEVRGASTQQLIKERDVASVLWMASKGASDSEGKIPISDTAEMTFALLRAARKEAKSQAMGNRSVTRIPCLAWDALIDLYGEESTLRERIDRLKAAQLPGSDDILKLADKYLGGWRPTPRNMTPDWEQ